MPRLRISIGRLLGWIALIAFGLAAFRAASELWSTLTLIGAIVALIRACLLARFGTKSERDWWFGFALLGWPHLLGTAVTVDSHLPSDLLLEILLFWPSIEMTMWPVFKVDHGIFSLEDHYRFQVSHNLLSLVAGWLGGWGVVWYAAWVRRRAVRDATGQSDG